MNFLSNLLEDLPMFLLSLPVILFALTVHEASHGYVAYRLGDTTARDLGRLTLNPIKHLDPIGTLMMVLFHIGWAKPVPINVRRFKNPRRDMAISAAAGPISNLLLAFIATPLFLLYQSYLFPQLLTTSMQGDGNAALFNFAQALLQILFMMVSLNISLAVFNLIPIPPFDGSRIFYIFLPTKVYFEIMRYEQYIKIGLLLFLWLGYLDGVIVTVTEFILLGMVNLWSLLPIF